MTRDGATPEDVVGQLGRVGSAAGQFERRTIVIVTLILAAASVTLAFAAKDTVWEQVGKAVGAAASGTAFVYAYLQWRAGRHEASYDKYYDRLENANRHYSTYRAEFLKDPDGAFTTHVLRMFLYAELDNLEFILDKYRLRYIRRDLAIRATRHFAARCRDEWFRSGVLEILTRDGAGYEAETRRAVELLTMPQARPWHRPVARGPVGRGA